MNDLFADVGYISLNHVGEELCGDRVETVRKGNELITVLADGLGSGVKANILSTLTSKIISTMIAEDMSVDECVKTMAATLPVCKKRGVAYSTFTIMRFTDNTEAHIIQFDNPLVILLRKGKNYEYPRTERIIEGKKIIESKIALQNDDVFIAMSDGAIYLSLIHIYPKRSRLLRLCPYKCGHNASAALPTFWEPCACLTNLSVFREPCVYGASLFFKVRFASMFFFSKNVCACCND